MRMTANMKRMLNDFTASYTSWRQATQHDYNLEAAVTYRITDLINELKSAFTAGGQKYAEAYLADELAYFKEQVAKEA